MSCSYWNSHSRGILVVSFPWKRGLRWKCHDQSTHNRRRASRIQGLRCESRMLQQVGLTWESCPAKFLLIDLLSSLTFGAGGKDFETGEMIDGWGYYETIAGGSGAGDGWHGTSGVHCHMTNTVSEMASNHLHATPSYCWLCNFSVSLTPKFWKGAIVRSIHCIYYTELEW